ncbi:MAG: MFS transporter [Cytophagales bacterium]|nr:MFS transporter [Cytophagales bacterium]
MTNTAERKINWPQIWSLAALNAAVAISWIAYHEYQPRLLEKFDFTHYAGFLAITQAIVMFLIPPVAGRIGDYFIKRDSNYFIVSTIGISVTAMIFMAVAFSISDVSFAFLHGVLPVMIVLWLISMNVFHSPANSMVELFASERDLPLAMGIIVLITDLIYSLEPMVVALVDYLGSTLTFVTGGVLIVVSGYFFRKTSGKVELKRDLEAKGQTNNYPKVIAVGLLSGLIFALINQVLPDIWQGKLSGMFPGVSEGGVYASVVLALAALGALPLSYRVRKGGVESSLIVGALISAAAVAGIMLTGQPLIIVASTVALALGFSIVAVSSFPYALMNISDRNATFGAGVFFAFVEVADNLLNALV